MALKTIGEKPIVSVWYSFEKHFTLIEVMSTAFKLKQWARYQSYIMYIHWSCCTNLPTTGICHSMLHHEFLQTFCWLKNVRPSDIRTEHALTRFRIIPESSPHFPSWSSFPWCSFTSAWWICLNIKMCVRLMWYISEIFHQLPSFSPHTRSKIWV